VRQVVVLAPETAGGDKRLVAYVVLTPGSVSGANEFRDFLKTRLPEYMIPSAFVFIDAVPLTPSGKVDKDTLARTTAALAEVDAEHVPGRTAVEKALVEEWERLLDVRPIGIADNFFDLGGHSLLGVRLIARIEKRFGKHVPVAVLFESPTIEKLAALIDRN